MFCEDDMNARRGKEKALDGERSEVLCINRETSWYDQFNQRKEIMLSLQLQIQPQTEQRLQDLQ